MPIAEELKQHLPVIAAVGGGGIVLFLIVRSHTANAANVPAPTGDTTGGSSSGSTGSDPQIAALQQQLQSQDQQYQAALAAMQSGEQQDIATLTKSIQDQASTYQTDITNIQNSFNQQLQQEQAGFNSQLGALNTTIGNENTTIQALQAALAKLQTGGNSPTNGGGGGGQTAFAFILPDAYYQKSNVFNQWGFAGNQLGAGRPAMQGISAGTILGDLGGIFFPVAYNPNQDHPTIGTFSTGGGFSGASWVLSRTYDIAKKYGQLGNQEYVQQILYTQLARMKQDLIDRGLPTNYAGFDLSSVVAYDPKSYVPGQVDLRGYTGPGSNYTPSSQPPNYVGSP